MTRKKNVNVNVLLVTIFLVSIQVLVNFGQTLQHQTLLERLENVALSLCFLLLGFACIQRVWLALLINSWWVLILPIAWYVKTTHHIELNQNFIGFIFETSLSEAANFLKTIPSSRLVFGLIFYLSFIWLIISCYRKNIQWIGRTRYWAISSGVIGIALIVFSSGPLSAFGEENTPREAFIQAPRESWHDTFSKIFPYDFIFSTQGHIKDVRQLEKFHKENANFTFDAKQTALNAPDLVVLVIGESSRVDRWSLFGYKRQTTPMLDKKSHIYPFSDMVSVSTATRSSVPSIISNHPVVTSNGHSATYQVAPSIVSLFENVGYRTWWISNQSPSGFYENTISFYAKEAQYIRYVNPGAWGGFASLDEIMLPLFESAIKFPKKTFVVLHTMGSHFNYVYRYPESFQKFVPSLSRSIKFEKNGNEFTIEASNSYDNSIAYTDYFLSEAIDQLKASGRSAVLLYVSDHGEDLKIDGCIKSGTGIRTSKSSYQVPAFIWLSDEYVKQHEDIVHAATERKNWRLSADSIFDTLADLG